MIRIIEELSINAWPAAETILYDGWILRFTGGYTRRSNSINPLYPSSLPLDQKIAYCEQLYRGKSLKTIFKLTKKVEPLDLDQNLSRLGYQEEAHTGVQTLELIDLTFDISQGVTLSPDLTQTWFSDYCSAAGTRTEDQPTLWKILTAIVSDHCFISIHSEGHPVAYGLAVVQAGYLGLFDILTEKAHRNQGYGQQIVMGLLDWGRRQGAERAYLQVMLNNSPALRLYARLGFQERYQYWYRVKG